MLLPIERDWEGRLLPEADRALVMASLVTHELVVTFDVPFFGDPPPPSAAGSTPHLWEHEVVELFIADEREHYLELEFGPHGHYLALELRGIRSIVRQGMPLVYEARIDLASAPPAGRSGPMGRYRGTARVPMSYLPLPPVRGNAYAIHGASDSRCYHAHVAVPGDRPDFHRLECFAPLEW